MIHLGEKRYSRSDLIRITKPGRKYSRVKSDITKKEWYENNDDIIDNYIGINPHGLFSIYTQRFNKNNLGIFMLYTTKNGKDIIYYGIDKNIISIYNDSMNNTRKLFLCKDLPHSVIYTYIDDSIDDIINLLNYKKIFFDKISINMNMYRKNRISAVKEPIYKNLKEFIETSGFWNIVDIENGISTEYKLHDTSRTQDYKYEVELSIRDAVNISNYITTFNIRNVTCLRYWYDIDLSTIKKDYCLIRDNYNNLYIVAYDKGFISSKMISDAGFSNEDIYKLVSIHR